MPHHSPRSAQAAQQASQKRQQKERSQTALEPSLQLAKEQVRYRALQLRIPQLRFRGAEAISQAPGTGAALRESTCPKAGDHEKLLLRERTAKRMSCVLAMRIKEQQERRRELVTVGAQARRNAALKRRLRQMLPSVSQTRGPAS